MPEIYIDAKTAGLKEFAANIERAKRSMIGQLGERGYQLLRKNVSELTGNLKQGVAPPDVNYESLEATLTVSARSAELPSRSGEVFNKKGVLTKTVTVNPSPAFNYAETVARGRDAIAPRKARSLMIPVTSRPSNEGYMMVDGQVFIFRRSARAVPANPYDERAAEQLNQEAAGIGEAILRKIFI